MGTKVPKMAVSVDKRHQAPAKDGKIGYGSGHGYGRESVTMVEKRFLTLADVAEVLNISSSQTYALVRSGELPAIQVGGRGQWRVEANRLEEYIAGAYEKSAAAVRDGSAPHQRESAR
jgi:excisionase family DNA binding protein